MRYREHAPSPPLARHVACYWSLATDGAPHRVLPDGCADLLFSLDDPGDARVIGVMSQALVTAPRAPQRLLGVRFRPGAAAALLGASGRALRDQAVPIGDLLGPFGRALEARVVEAHGVAAAIAVIEEALCARIDRLGLDPRVERAVAAIRDARGQVSIAALAWQTGLGDRQLERRFQDTVGIGPKAFARVVRLQALLEEAAAARAPAWAALAADLGFADQSHLIREVTALAGVTPARWIAERAALRAERAEVEMMSETSNPAESPAAILTP
jgi:AraC-like DNA-binding protein